MSAEPTVTDAEAEAAYEAANAAQSSTVSERAIRAALATAFAGGQ